MKKNVLEETLLETGTGVLEGFFRLPVGLDQFSLYLCDRNYFDDVKNHADNNYAEHLKDFESKCLKMGTMLTIFEAHYKCPTINVSDRNGRFLGTYEITRFDFYEFFLDLKSEKFPDMNLRIHTYQNLDGDTFGSCRMYIYEGAREFFNFELR